MIPNLKGVTVKYNDVEYKVTRHKEDKVNLCFLNNGKVVHKDVLISELRIAGGNKERKIKGFRY
jgi:hypothetical protein